MLKYQLICTSILVFVLSCNPQGNPDSEEPKGLASAFNINYWDGHLFFDTLANRLYYVPRLEHEDIISYDYEQKKILARAPKGFSESFNDSEAAFGYFQGRRELYIGHGSTINIYSAENLSLIDSITTPDDIGFLRFTSMANLHDSLIFITCCGNVSGVHGLDRSRVYHRSEKKMVPGDHHGDNCATIRTFEIGGAEKNYGVILMINYYNQFALERYDHKGNLVDVKYSEYTWLNWDKPIGVSDGSPYFIVSSDGQLISKQDLSPIGVLGSDCLDYHLSLTGDKIYGLGRFGSIEVYDYPSLQKIKTIAPPVGVGNAFVPYRIFQDGNQLIRIFYNNAGVFMDFEEL